MFSLRLKALRENAGYSQAQLARILNVRQSTVAMWENGTNKPQNAKLEQLATIFNVTTDYLLGRVELEPWHPPASSVKINVYGTVPAGVPLEANESGQDCVVYINGYDATLKQVKLLPDGGVRLQPLNPSYAPKTYYEGDETITIAGVVVEIRRKP